MRDAPLDVSQRPGGDIASARICAFGGVMQFLAAVAVLKTNDIILAEIGSGLHLDQVKRLVTIILKAMNFADRDVC